MLKHKLVSFQFNETSSALMVEYKALLERCKRRVTPSLIDDLRLAGAPSGKKILLRLFSDRVSRKKFIQSFFPKAPTIKSLSSIFTLDRKKGGHTREIKSIAWSPDGKAIVSSSEDCTLKILNPSSKEVFTLDWSKKTIGHFQGVMASAVAWSPDGKLLACGCSDGIVRFIDSVTKSVIFEIDQKISRQIGGIESVSWSPNGKLLAYSGVNNDTLIILDITAKEVVFSLDFPDKHSSHISSIAWHPKGKLLAYGTREGIVRIIKPNNKKTIYSLRRKGSPVNSIAWSPDGRFLASGSNNQILDIIDTTTRKVFFSLDKNPAGKKLAVVCSVAWSPDSKFLACGNGFDIVSTLDLKTKKVVISHLGGDGGINAVAWSPDGNFLAAGGFSWDLNIIKVELGKDDEA